MAWKKGRSQERGGSYLHSVGSANNTKAGMPDWETKCLRVQTKKQSRTKKQNDEDAKGKLSF